MNKEKIYCHWDIVRFLKEEQIPDNCCVALEHVEGESEYDLMIYLYKEGDKYLVDVYKSEDENDFDRFPFDDFVKARVFVDNLPYKHPEHRGRPFVKIN